MSRTGTVYLIPSLLDEQGIKVFSPYLIDAIKDCRVFFTENERTARRFLKQLWKDIVIDDYEWFAIHKSENEVINVFREKLRQGINTGIISEAGCPGVADPGQSLVAAAHELNAEVKPLVGPSSILLALMASGLNGQQFRFNGYLPIDNHERIKAIRELEAESKKKNCTEVFIETPYRNSQLFEALLSHCKPATRLCIACDLTGASEWIRTMTIARWRKEKVNIQKRPAIFLLLSR
jgi:16S rRNA (cytidine1402-2'-O)-methyltransferase